jgi:hypothetical protein
MSLLSRALRFAVPLLLALLAIERAYLYGRARSYVHQAGKINLVMQHRVSPEIAIFGASNALIDFDAPLLEKLLGKATFDYGVAGVPLLQYQALVREAAVSTPRCDEVVLAESFMTFMGLDSIRNPDMWLPHVDSPAVYEVLRRIDPAAAWKARYLPLYGLVVADQDGYKVALRGYLTLLGRPPANDQVQGYEPKDDPWQPPAPAPPGTVLPYAYDERVVPQLTELVDLLNRAGKRVTMVVTPIQASCHRGLPYLDAHNDKLRALVGGENAFLDYTHHPITQDTASFSNCGHLNRRGAAAFARIFAADFAALPPRRRADEKK